VKFSSKRFYILAALGVLLMGYGVLGWKTSSESNIFGLFNEQFKQVTKKYEANADTQLISEEEKNKAVEIEKPELSKRYAYYRECLEGATPCEGFSTQDGDLYLSEVRSQMLSEITALYEELVRNPQSLIGEHEKTAQVMLTDATPDMQVLGFQILELFPISEINLDLVAQTTEDAFDVGVVNAGLQALERYKDTPAFKTRVTAAFVQQIGLGVNDQAAVQAIEKLPVFLTSENKSQFKDLLKQLGEASRKSAGLQRRYKALEKVLR
jgi:hypothetical protein